MEQERPGMSWAALSIVPALPGVIMLRAHLRGCRPKYSPHFEVARFKKRAHIDWLQFIAEDTILILRRGA